MKTLGRLLLRGLLLVAVPAAAAAAALYYYAIGGRYVTAENAYVKADIINISPDIDGRVARVLVSDNQPVDDGQLLFEIDPEPYEIALAAAEAEIAAVRQRVASLRAHYREGELEVAAADERIRFLTIEYERQQQLESKGIGARVVSQGWWKIGELA